jgi:hypothetical protein
MPQGFAIFITTIFVISVSVTAAISYLLIRTKTLSVLQRNIYRFLVMVFVWVMLGLLGYLLSGEIQALTTLLIVLLPLSLVGHLIYGLAEYIRIKKIIRLEERMRQARQVGDLELARTYHRRMARLKRFTFGSFKELQREG